MLENKENPNKIKLNKLQSANHYWRFCKQLRLGFYDQRAKAYKKIPLDYILNSLRKFTEKFQFVGESNNRIEQLEQEILNRILGHETNKTDSGEVRTFPKKFRRR